MSFTRTKLNSKYLPLRDDPMRLSHPQMNFGSFAPSGALFIIKVRQGGCYFSTTQLSAKTVLSQYHYNCNSSNATHAMHTTHGKKIMLQIIQFKFQEGSDNIQGVFFSLVPP